MENPPSKMITDEASGIEVKNPLRIAWDAGAKAERERLAGIMRLHLEKNLGLLINWCKVLQEE